MLYKDLKNLSLNEILDYMKSCGVTEVSQISNTEKFIKVLNITDLPKKCYPQLYIYYGDNTLTNGYIKVTFGVELEEDIKFHVEFHVNNRYVSAGVTKIAISNRLDFTDWNSTGSMNVYKQIDAFFDSRPEYNNLAVRMYEFDTNKKTKLSDYYKLIVNYRKEVQPHINSVLEYMDNGGYVKDYLKYTGYEFPKGNAIMEVYNFEWFINILNKHPSISLDDCMAIVKFLSLWGKKIENENLKEKLGINDIKENVFIEWPKVCVQHLDEIKNTLLKTANRQNWLLKIQDDYQKEVKVLTDKYLNKYELTDIEMHKIKHSLT